jgi:hypothetical protein
MNGDSFVGRIAEGRPASLKRRLSALLPQFWTRDRAFRRSFEPCHLLRRTKALHPRPSSAPANNEVMVIAAQEVARIQVTNIKFKCRTFKTQSRSGPPLNIQTMSAPSRNIKQVLAPTYSGIISQPSGLGCPSGAVLWSQGACALTSTPSRSCNLTTSALFSGALNTSAGIPAAMSADRT